jgi:phytoene desaturase
LLNKKIASVAIIGSGFSGLSASSVLAKAGADVTVYEKHDAPGGRARVWEREGYTFDMGPSWYWMPDVFERYYNLFGHTTHDFYELKKLDPGFRVIFGNDNVLDVPKDFDELCTLFESREAGAGSKLIRFMDQAEYKYRVGMQDLVYKPGLSVFEFFSWQLARDVFKLQVFSAFSKHIRSFFKDPCLIALLEFPSLFLGAMPKDTPALYSLMSYAGLKQGTYYPMGGFGKVVDAFATIAGKSGVTIRTSENVDALGLHSGKVNFIESNGISRPVNAVLATADYHHVERNLLPENYRMYSERYWKDRVMAPSCLIFYLGINKKIKRLVHHNLFFDEDLAAHASSIYVTKHWPANPLFYVCCPSVTDPSVAPEGCENIFMLMPVAPGLDDADASRDHYYDLLMGRLEKFTGEEIKSHVVVKRSYSVSDFVSDYNAYKGNAYGLANTLFQTAFFKPRMHSRKVSNLFYAGQLTVPGPGVPPSIISGQVAAHELIRSLN